MERERVLEAFEESRLTQRAFAPREGIKYRTFACWVRGRRHRSGEWIRAEQTSPRLHFVEASLSGLALPPDGTTLRGGEAGVDRLEQRVRELWSAQQSLSSKQLRDQWRRFILGWWNYFRLADRLWGLAQVAGCHFTAMQAVWATGDADFTVAFEHLHQRIERGRVLAQALPFVESEDRHAAGRILNDFAADDPAVLVVDEFEDMGPSLIHNLLVAICFLAGSGVRVRCGSHSSCG